MQVKANYSVLRVWPHQSGMIFATVRIAIARDDNPEYMVTEASVPVENLEREISRIVKAVASLWDMNKVEITAEVED